METLEITRRQEKTRKPTWDELFERLDRLQEELADCPITDEEISEMVEEVRQEMYEKGMHLIR